MNVSYISGSILGVEFLCVFRKLSGGKMFMLEAILKYGLKSLYFFLAKCHYLF